MIVVVVVTCIAGVDDKEISDPVTSLTLEHFRSHVDYTSSSTSHPTDYCTVPGFYVMPRCTHMRKINNEIEQGADMA